MAVYTVQFIPSTSGPIRDSAGKLYGTTMAGGVQGSCRRQGGCGVVFKLDATGTETVLHRFKGFPTDGWFPTGLIGDSAGNLYGTTFEGGISDRGTVFKLDKTGETVLHSFTGGADGGEPSAGMIGDSTGNLYGTTNSGGILNSICPSGCGTVFKLDTTGRETVLYSFTGADGAYPYAGLIRDSEGNLYGTTYYGGLSDNGVVFVIHP